jgi:uncharacterized repeat protein (TIGR03806 family)
MFLFSSAELTAQIWVLYKESIGNQQMAGVLLSRFKGAAMGLALVGTVMLSPQSSGATAPYGMPNRVPSKPFLNMPRTIDGTLPKLLSQTGVFSDTPHLKVIAGLIPYELVVHFWSDGAQKSRWIALPAGKIKFSPTEEWQFPAGTIFVKTFELPTDARDPTVTRRLETRLLVRNANGGVYGVVYKWRADGSDAELLPGSKSEPIAVRDASGRTHEQTWYYPSRQDCMTCHNSRAGGVLGVKTRQMNRSIRYPSGISDNELRAWNHLGLFEPKLDESKIGDFLTLAASDDESRSISDRARSYLDANCSQCHRPHGTVANFDARYETAPDEQAIVDGPVLIDQGIDHPRVVSPHDIWRSIAYMRVDTNGDIRMPPIARETIDEKGVALLGAWIESLPGREVLAPPLISPAGGSFTTSVAVTLEEAEPGANLHYTLDGSVPGPSDPLYTKPITLSGPTVLRARAYKDGFTRSITTQEVFIVGK